MGHYLYVSQTQSYDIMSMRSLPDRHEDLSHVTKKVLKLMFLSLGRMMDDISQGATRRAKHSINTNSQLTHLIIRDAISS